MTKKKLVLILPALNPGGMERVMTLLAEHFTRYPDLHIDMLLMTRKKKFYTIPASIELHEPKFYFRGNRLISILKVLIFVRQKLKYLKPDIALSFGGKYNSFVILAALGLNIRLFVSDRSRPSKKYGKLQDLLNPILYRKATGIIAQTKRAQELIFNKTRHPNIRVIGNPIIIPESTFNEHDKIILNIGRFISSKNQLWLIDYFNEVVKGDWQLYFLGEGPNLEKVKIYASQTPSLNRIHFLGNVQNIEEWYNKSSIFAFTSLSEGFPNALGEAMAYGLACISFDCEAGPSELIDHGINGWLIEPSNHESFKTHLKLLCNDFKLRQQFGKEAQEKIKIFNLQHIGSQYYEFLVESTK